MAQTPDTPALTEEETKDPIFNPETGGIEPMEQNAEEQGEWLEESYEGQLAVDVYQKGDDIVIVSTIAGVRAADIQIDVNNDMVTIKGVRRQETEEESEYFYRECYWGGFSRTIILPVDVRPDDVRATLKNGVLTVRLRALKPQQVEVQEIEDR
jgi:HSP20 family protein